MFIQQAAQSRNVHLLIFLLFLLTEYCHCNAIGSYGSGCDPVTRQCTCKPFVGGLRCDRCEIGYWGLHKIADFGNTGCIGRFWSGLCLIYELFVCLCVYLVDTVYRSIFMTLHTITNQKTSNCFTTSVVFTSYFQEHLQSHCDS